MPTGLPKLTDLLKQRFAQDAEPRTAWQSEQLRASRRLAARGITTLGELVAALPSLPPKLKNFGICWLGEFKPAGSEAALLRLMHADSAFRVTCAHELGWMKGRRAAHELIRIGSAELATAAPDVHWLDAVVHGLKSCDQSGTVEILVAIFERSDLPGWLRGDAGDALGCQSELQDRRTSIFRRVWAAALPGLDHADIDVQFWSMYVIMQLAKSDFWHNHQLNRFLRPALPRLREIAKNDHRLAPGYWWPMCEEAKDAIHIIETGQGLDHDAADRCEGNTELGPMCFRY